MKLIKLLSLGIVLLTANANAVYIPKAYLGAGDRVKNTNVPFYSKALTCVIVFHTNNDFKRELNKRIAQCRNRNSSVPLGDVIDYSIVDRANDYTKIYLTLEIKENCHQHTRKEWN